MIKTDTSLAISYRRENGRTLYSLVEESSISLNQSISCNIISSAVLSKIKQIECFDPLLRQITLSRFNNLNDLVLMVVVYFYINSYTFTNQIMEQWLIDAGCYNNSAAILAESISSSRLEKPEIELEMLTSAGISIPFSQPKAYMCTIDCDTINSINETDSETIDSLDTTDKKNDRNTKDSLYTTNSSTDNASVNKSGNKRNKFNTTPYPIKDLSIVLGMIKNRSHIQWTYDNLPINKRGDSLLVNLLNYSQTAFQVEDQNCIIIGFTVTFTAFIQLISAYKPELLSTYTKLVPLHLRDSYSVGRLLMENQFIIQQLIYAGFSKVQYCGLNENGKLTDLGLTESLYHGTCLPLFMKLMK